MRKLFTRIFWVCWLLAAYPASAGQGLRIGVLAFQDKASTLAQWQATAAWLNRAVPGFEFEVLPLTYGELDAEVSRNRLAFVLTNPEHYVVLRNRFKLRPMATIAQRIDHTVVDQFGSVILTRSNSQIRSLGDVRGKRVAAVGANSLGGYLIAADQFLTQGIELRFSKDVQLNFLGVPHSKVVKAVIDGKADVGIVRTGVLEQMVSSGQLDLKQLNVLNRRPIEAFPQVLSTELYPEWPLAAMPGTPPEISKAVLLALLQISPDSNAALAGHYQGFSVPANYTVVEELMRRMHVYPGMPEPALWRALWERYEDMLKPGIGLLAVFVLLVLIRVMRSNRRLRELTQLSRSTQTELELAAAAFNGQVGLIVTDGLTCIQRANAAMFTVLGYSQEDLLGQATSLLRSSTVAQGTLRSIWQEVQRFGRWQGELLCRHRLGHDVPCMVSISMVHNATIGLSGFVGSFTDISIQKSAEADIRKLAYFDHLTQLPNRRKFMDALAQVQRDCLDHGYLASVMFIDLDHFKNLNDAHGHAIGDELLRRLARRLEFLLGPNDMAARLGGDEFVVMMSQLEWNEARATQQTLELAQRIHHALLDPFDLETPNDVDPSLHMLRYNCSGSIGVALLGMHDEPVTEVLKRADVAMYKSKQDGRNLIRQYDPAAQQLLNAHTALTNDLNIALSDDQLFLLYQPQVDADNMMVGAECLMRWEHPVRGLISPTEFIALAEESGAIVGMGYWAIQTACETLARWAKHPSFNRLTLSVNVSPRQFNESDFVQRIGSILRGSGAPAQRLRLEVTEGVMMEEPHKVITQMHELCDLGLSFSVDDFGTGYSSLSYIQRLPLVELKIDKSFVSDVTDNPRSEAIVKAVIALGRSMGVVIVSEGVETEQQRQRLLGLGCTLIQGYLIARPMTGVALEAFMLKTSPAVRDDSGDQASR